MHIIDGKKIAQEVLERLKLQKKPEKFFAAILVGNDLASLNFLKQKERIAHELGIDFRLYTLDPQITTDALRREIARLAGPKQCGACIVQLPLPLHINRHYALNAIPREKDPDLLSEAALGAFYTGRNPVVPPSVATIEEILKRHEVNLRELKVVLVGAGFLIGKPAGFWLQNRVAELTVLDRHVHDIRAHLRDADVVISGVGHGNLFSADDIKDGAIVIDFGWNKVDGKITGDFDPVAVGHGLQASSHKSSVISHESRGISYTPTPGGTGPILVAKLFENFYILTRTRLENSF